MIITRHGKPGYLIDTNAVLIALTDPNRLSRSVRCALLAGSDVLGTASYWEVVLKSMEGTLGVGYPRSWWNDALDQLAATVLPIRPELVAAVYGLPSHHKGAR